MKRLLTLSIPIAIFLLVFIGQAVNQGVVTSTLKFKVGVHVACENENIKNLVESYINRELRSLHDVEIVKELIKKQWSHVIQIHILEGEYKSGEKTGQVAINVQFLKRIPIHYFKEDWQPAFKIMPAVYYPILGGGRMALWSTDNLDQYAKQIVADFDMEKLEGHRR